MARVAPPPNDMNRVVEALGRLSSRATLRNARFDSIRTKLVVIRLIAARLVELIPPGGAAAGPRAGPGAAIPDMRPIIARINESTRASNLSDRRRNELNRELTPLMVSLETLYGQVRPPGPPNPADQAIDAARNAVAAADTAAENDARREDALINAAPPGTYDGDNNIAEMRGGYKHSRTNSRKYMVKRFRSLRGSLKRDKKRKRKTLRRRSHRK